MSLSSRVFSGLRFRLFVLVALACAPLVLLMIHTGGEERRREMASWEQRSQKLLQIAQREEDEIRGGTRQLLLALAESAPVRTGNRRNAKKLLDDLFASYPRYANLGVVGTNGEVLASAAPIAEPANQSDRRYFHQALEFGGFVAGDFPSKRTTGKPTLDFGFPVVNSAGEIDAVVFASLDLEWFNHFASQVPSQLPKGATWSEIDHNGIILARYPDPKPEGWVGRPLPEQTLLKEVYEQPRGTTEAPDANGVPSFYSYASMPSKLGSGSVVTILGIPKQVLFAQADSVLNRNLRWLGIAAAFALGFGWVGSRILILHPVKALVKASAQLATGDLSVRTGLPHGKDELGQLTLAFDQMAEALEHREQERQRASHKLHVLSHRLVEVQETERRQIARELHDEIGQTLTTAEMHLQAALRSPRAASLERRLEESIQAVERVLEQVHDISLNLRPSMLDDLGLEPALRWYTQRQASLAGLTAHFHADPLDERIDGVIETECFRVAQEALTNVVRHAKATEVNVELTRQNGNLHLSVRDDGIGFDVAASRQQAVLGSSLGLLSMEERASLAGGGIEYRSGNGQGTEIHAWFPLKWKSTPTTTLTEFNE